MKEIIIIKPKQYRKYIYLISILFFIFSLVYLWIDTNKEGYIIIHNCRLCGPNNEFVLYHFYIYFYAIILIPVIISTIKEYLTFRKCKIILNDNNIQLFLLKRKYITPNQYKGIKNKIKYSFYPIVDWRNSSKYYNILVEDTILYKDIVAVDKIKNLKANISYSHSTDLGIISKEKKYFIDSLFYSKKNIKLIKEELIKRANINKENID